MSGQKAITALMVAHGVGAQIAFNSSGGAADWIMLMPIGPGNTLTTVDGRGPYRVGNIQNFARESLQAAGGRLAIDENHSTDLAAPRGEPAPARGWATDLEVRNDGIYGRVEWSTSGAALMSEKAYRFISPVFTHDKTDNVLRLLRASLTNTPNLRGMAALHAQENNMDLLAQLRKILGLPDTADEAAVIAKVQSACGGDNATAMQSIAKAAGLADTADTATVLSTVTTLKAGTALASIAKAAGLKEGADAPAIVTAVTALAAGKSPATDEVVKSLQSEVATVTTRLNDLLTSTGTANATAFIDGEIAKGRVGVKPMREHYISRHAASAEGAAAVVKEIGAMPILGPSGAMQTPPASQDGKVALNSEQLAIAKLIGTNPEAYAKTLAAEQNAA
jgi:phage I-like protein